MRADQVGRMVSAVHKAYRQVSLVLERPVRGRNLAMSDAHILAFLRRYGPVSVGELRRVFGHKKSTMSSVLDRLEAQSLLRRTLHPQDRRTYAIEASDAGRRLAASLEAPVKEFEAAVRERVDERDWRGFLAVTQAIDAVSGEPLRGRDEDDAS